MGIKTFEKTYRIFVKFEGFKEVVKAKFYIFQYKIFFLSFLSKMYANFKFISDFCEEYYKYRKGIRVINILSN